LNDARVLRPRPQGGYALPAQWSDDFHHSLHTLLIHETRGYYADFGSVTHLAGVLRDGWFYDGKYSAYRRRRHGNSPRGIPRSHFVVSSQNHDQVGNRAQGDRLSTLLNFEGQKLAAGLTLLSPFVPLLFMGEEYADPAPFLYFTSHGDKVLAEAVRRGRREEFAGFGWQGPVADPQDEATFANSKLCHHLRDSEPHRTMRSFYAELLRFRRTNLLGADADWEVDENESQRILRLLRRSPGARLFMIFNFASDAVVLPRGLPPGYWTREIDSADAQWGGPGDRLPRTAGARDTILLPGHSVAVYRCEEGD
jgi:maltooligosyltrehalose trehalohydrolase